MICGHADALCWNYCSVCPGRWTGACCAPDTGVCNIKTLCDCIEGGGIYRGDATTCGLPNLCKGACCISVGDCLEASFSRCVTVFGGDYQGDGTQCAPGSCGSGG